MAMTPQQIKAFCAHLDIRMGGRQSAGWQGVHCPLAPWRHDHGTDRDPSLGIHVAGKQLIPRVWCFSCQFAGDLEDLLLTLRRLSGDFSNQGYADAYALLCAVKDADQTIVEHEEQEETNPENIVFEFPQFWLDSFKPLSSSLEGTAYLTHSRKQGTHPFGIIKHLDLRWDAIERRVCFPIRNRLQQLVGLHGRAIDDDGLPRYRMYSFAGHNNPQFWYGESWVTEDRPVVVVESVFDLARVYQCYRNVCCALTASASEARIYRLVGLCPTDRWITMYDHGKAGDRARAKFSKVLNNKFVRHLPVTESQKDPGQMSLAEIMEALTPHVPAFDPLIV